MLKLIMGIIAIISGIVGFVYHTAAPAHSLVLLASGLYLTKLGNDEREREKINNRLGIITEKNMPEISFQEKNIDTDRQEYLLERYDKARNDFLALQDAKTKTRDKALHNQLEKMEKIAGRLLTYLSTNPEKIPVAQKFIDYYQDRALMLVNRYFDLANTGLQTSEVNERREKVVRAIFLMDEAYEAEFHKVLAADFLDIDAEIDVIESNMKSAGITDNKNYNLPNDTNTINVTPPDIKGSISQRMAEMKRLAGYKSEDVPILYNRSDVLTSKIIQSILAIVLGSFGAHKFYTGKTFQGVIYCLLFWTMIPGFIGVFEGIRYLVMPMDDYYEEYYLLRNKR